MSTARGRSPASARVIRFPPFELDVRAAELRKHGIRVRLHDQPYRILLTLLSRPGEVVLREEIRKLLWPDDTVVEFDRSINAAVQRLRDALGDSAENPRYVETLARRGYRFIGVVERAENQPLEEPAAPVAGGLDGAERGARLSRSKYYWTAAASLCLLLAATLVWRPHPEPERTVEFEILAPGESRFTDYYQATAISPDGRWIAFRAEAPPAPGILWLRPLDSAAARPLAGTEGVAFPFWSPDSKSLAFFANGKLKRIEIAGGPPVTLCDARRVNGGTWSSEGLLLFASEGNLLRIPAAGGRAEKVTEPDATRHEIGHLHPQFLPGGRRFLYQIKSPDPNTRGIYAGSLDNPGERRRLLATNYKALYTASRNGHPGMLLWLRQQTLMAQRFDAGSLRLGGEAVTIADGVAVNRLDHAAFWAADAGILAYRTGSNNSWLAWVDRNGKRLEEMQPGGRFDALALSPDGKRVALCRADGDNNSDVWIYEFGRKLMTRLTYGAGPVDSPVWSPDGRQIAFSSSRSGTFQIYRRNADGGGQEEQLTEGPADKFPDDWSRDGRYLLFEQRRRNQVSAIWRLPLAGGGKPVPLLEAPFLQVQASVSPDGKWIVYQSTESGRSEVYVRPFSGGSPGPGGKVQISTDVGGWPRWAADGTEIFYHLFTSHPRLMAVRIRMGKGGIEAETPVELFYFGGTASSTAHLWDVTADGQRFLTAGQVGAGSAGSQQIGCITCDRLNVVVNWHARVNR